jgi:uncharacterized protein involved in outer membrane biogenesis
MRRIWMYIISSVVLLAILSFIVPFFLDFGSKRAVIEQAIAEKTGLRISLGGEISLALLPEISVKLKDVSLETQNENQAPIVSVKSVTVICKLLPLLKRQIVIDKILLDTPEIRLIRHSGAPWNWQQIYFDKQAWQEKTSYLQLASNRLEGLLEEIPGSEENGSFPAAEPHRWIQKIAAWKLREVSIKNGSVILQDELQNNNWKITDWQLDTALLADKNPFIFQLKLEGSQLAKPMSIAVNGSLRLAESKLALESMQLKIDEITGYAHLMALFHDITPKFKAGLDLDDVDLRPYLQQNSANNILPKMGPLILVGGIENNANVGNNTAAPAASFLDAPINIEWMKQMDAHLGLRVKSLILPQLQTGKISLSSQLQHGKLSVQLKEAELYNGTLVGALHLDSGQLPPAVSTRITITDIQTKDIPGFSYLEGKVTAEGEVKSVGANMQQWLNNLEGTLFLKISEAVLKGGDVLAMISNVSGSFDPDKRKNSNTQITEVTGTFQIERGVMRGDDLHIRTPLLGIFGKGSINLAEQTIDYRLDPEPISLNSEAGEIGVRIPLIVRGPLNSPVIVPDIERTLKDLIRNTAPLEKQLEKHLGREIKLNIKELRLDQKTTDQLKDGIQKQLGKELNKLLDGSQ